MFFGLFVSLILCIDDNLGDGGEEDMASDGLHAV